MIRRYYHGGVRRLRVGDRIEAPTRTGVPSSADYGAEGICRRDRVYLTTDLQSARTFASLYYRGALTTGGDVYRVEPIGEVEPDPDCNTPGLSWQAPAARVVEVIERKVKRPHGLGMVGVR